MSTGADEHYWSVIDPVWDELCLSWDDPDEFVRRFAATPEIQRNLYAAHWCDSEVNNGGFHQFFWNTTGVLAPEAAAAYRAIGIPERAAVVEEAMRFFGDPFPRIRGVRIRALDEFRDLHPETRDPFRYLEDRFYAWEQQDHGRWERIANEYARGARRSE